MSTTLNAAVTELAVKTYAKAGADVSIQDWSNGLTESGGSLARIETARTHCGGLSIRLVFRELWWKPAGEEEYRRSFGNVLSLTQCTGCSAINGRLIGHATYKNRAVRLIFWEDCITAA